MALACAKPGLKHNRRLFALRVNGEAERLTQVALSGWACVAAAAFKRKSQRVATLALCAE
ncbi:MAG: hypothetical protein CVU73_08410 [Deltaproteobacteria bacterium HGW-Deltaproteobacteria-8]|jgi:hypothetical protein|nr:MAG: hypothetical protein CVU73_08410 [Deltaproteobacteria bacterium HGW-Deltaproteobacteria-8]